MASSSTSTQSTRRKHKPQGDTPGKPATKKHDNRGRRKQLFTETQEEKVDTLALSQPTQKTQEWSPLEKKCLICFFVDKGASHWPTHQHKPDSSDIWSECSDVVSKTSGIMRKASACRTMVFKLKKVFHTPDVAMDEYKESDAADVVELYEKLEGEDERLNVIDDLFQLQLQERDLDNYSPTNVPSLSLLAMEKLKAEKRPNSVFNLLECLTGHHEDGKQRLDIDRMPYPLLETNLQFFASEMHQQVTVHPTYHQWLGTMYAQFGERFLALFTGPMWKAEREEDEDEELHRQVLTKALKSSQQSPAQQSEPLPPSPVQRLDAAAALPDFKTSTPVQPSTLWRATDLEEIAFTQAEGGHQDSRQREKELLRKHGLQTQYRKQRPSVFKTKDALVNVVGLSASQLRKDFAKTEYTPGSSIQKTMLKQAHKENPNAKWWIKADACDLSRGLRESMTNEWSGDVDMGDGKLQLLHAQYKTTLRNISTMVLANLQEYIQQLEDEVPEIEKGKKVADDLYEDKKKAGMVGGRLLPYVWELQGWRDLKQQNEELRQALTAAFEEDKREDIPTLKVQLQKYQKGIYTKRRTMATHLLIFMISDELRNRKPYAVPVKVMPITTVKDATIRRLQNEVKGAMEEVGMKVVGFVTDGEWNSLRTMGTTRPTTLIQLVMEAKREAASMKKERLEPIFKPKIEHNEPAAGKILIRANESHEAVPFADISNIGVDIIRGFPFKTALHNQHKRLYRFTPNPLPWVPGTSEEKSIECMRSLLATYLFRAKVKYWKAQGVDFMTNLYVPDVIHDREDHGHLFKRIVKCVRLGQVEDADISRWIEALQDERTFLTASALRGVDPQSVPDCERMFSKGVINFLEEKGYDRDAKFAKLLHNWHKATDGRGLSEKERHDYNIAMLNYILDEWIPGHKEHKDFSQVDVNKPLKGIRGLTRETVIGLTTNISSQELRRLETAPPEHPRASTSDDVECFIAILHHMLGRTFDFKAFNNAYRKIFTEFQKMLDTELPFYYYRSLKGRFTTDPLPDFNVPSSSGVERLDRVRGSRFGHPGTSLTSRSRMPRHGGRTIRDAQHRKEEPLPSLHLDI